MLRIWKVTSANFKIENFSLSKQQILKDYLWINLTESQVDSKLKAFFSERDYHEKSERMTNVR